MDVESNKVNVKRLPAGVVFQGQEYSHALQAGNDESHLKTASEVCQSVWSLFMRAEIRRREQEAVLGQPVHFGHVGLTVDSNDAGGLNVTINCDYSLSDPEDGFCPTLANGKMGDFVRFQDLRNT